MAVAAASWRENLLGAWRALPKAARSACGERQTWLVALAALVAAALLTALCKFVLPAPAPASGVESAAPAVAPGVLAASFVLDLLFLSAFWFLLPLPQRRCADSPPAQPAWAYLRAWLQGAIVATTGWLGWLLLSGTASLAYAALLFAALTAGQGALLCGLAAAGGALAGRFQQIARLTVLVLVTAAATGLFWSRPLLQYLYREAPSQAPAVAGAVVEWGPVTAVGTAWHELDSGFDLLKAPLTYRVWMGSYELIPYPHLWPGWHGGGGMEKPLECGLVLKYLLVGLLLLVLGDLWSLLRPCSTPT